MAPKRNLRVVIVGGGISGIAQAVRLQEALGKHVVFTVFERDSDVGGVWRDSTWPGTAVDVPIHLYCLYSHLNPSFSSKWAGRDEVLAYWKRIVTRHSLQDRFVFETEFVGSRWDATTQMHTVTFRRVKTGETFEVITDILVAATGALNKPIIPNVPGRDKFEGLQWHSSRWNNEVDLKGKRLAVVGNGSSGIQVIPNIVDIEGIHITQFIRSPGYFRPKVNFEYSFLQRLLFRIPGVLRLYRWKIYLEYDRNILSRGTGTWTSDLRERMTTNIVAYMKRELPEKYHDTLIPKYPMHCKRVAYDAGWLASLNRPNVELIADPIVAVDETGIITKSGRHVEVDCIAWATGFEVSETGVGLNKGVYGEDGRELREVWKERKGAYGYLGVAVPGVPNYFAVLGPNAISQSWGWTLGHNTELIARIIRGIYDQRLSSIVVKPEVMDAYNEYLGTRLEHTSLASPQCGTSWYKDPNTNKIVAPAPWGATELWTRARKIRWEDFLARRFPSPGSADDKPYIVELTSARTWTPWGIFVDWLAARLQKWLVRLMVEVEPGREEGLGKLPPGDPAAAKAVKA
ncbi:flavin-containing monooxygenase [Rhodotorula paludigena]|uniref:flavin-containing monooxygenase n=1 Tax=Rhodotorula paludigena TaxID=86838 RepID=UPI00316BEBB5